MKARVQLYNKGARRMIDIYEIGASARTESIADKANRAYKANYNQASHVFKAIQINNRQNLSPACIRHVATFIVQSWEVDTEQSKIDEVASLMNHLARTTEIQGPLDDALKQFCRNPAGDMTPCAVVTLLFAASYVKHLKRRYSNIKGTNGCSQRLISVAYQMAIKYIHANLRLIIDASPVQETLPPRRFSLPRLSGERSTLKTPTALITPPTSPNPEQVPDARCPNALRMELEFLHFLNYNLSIANPVALVHWAQTFDMDSNKTEPSLIVP